MKKLLLSFLLITGFYLPVNALTWSQIRTEIRVRIKDTSTVRQRYSDTLLLNLANEGQREINLSTRMLQQRTNTGMTAGTTYYAFTAISGGNNVLDIVRLTLNWKILPQTTKTQLDSLNGGSTWELTSGQPTHYFIDSAQPLKYGFYPSPSTSFVASTPIVHIDMLVDVLPMSLDSDSPFTVFDLSGVEAVATRYKPYHDTVIYYVVYQLYLLEGETEKATAYSLIYQAKLKNMKETLNDFQNYNPGLSGTGGGR